MEQKHPLLLIKASLFVGINALSVAVGAHFTVVDAYLAVINHVERELRDVLFVTDAAPFAAIPAKAGIHLSLCNSLS
jgi:hypothetical protein